MKHITLILGLSALFIEASAQQKPKIVFPQYEFTAIKANPITPVKDQYRSGTCWCFSGIGLIESEIIRQKNITDTLKYPDLSEMFVVSKSYQDKADKYVRLSGHLNFAAGSETDDVFDVIRDYGIVPQDAMPGLNYGTDKPVHGELDALLHSYVSTIVKLPNRNKLSTAWKNGFNGIVNAYLGECPESFTKDGATYTPASYRDALGIVPDDYITLTSYTHHPLYTKFALELADNWRWDGSWNVPIDELMNTLDAAINNGFTIEWATDVSNPGFSRDGLAFNIDPETKPATAGSDQEKWVGSGEAKKQPVLEPVELFATQESRQEGFDNKSVTDDHGMLIYGIARDQKGGKFYMVKNSWGGAGRYKGIWYVTEQYVRQQTISLTLHKDALSKDLKKKIGIK